MNTTITFRKKLLGSSQLNWRMVTRTVYGRKSLKGKKFRFFAFLLFFSFLIIPTEAFSQFTSGFELDGNAATVSGSLRDDWSLISVGTSNAEVSTGILADASLVSGGDNIFINGSKDVDDVSAWHWGMGTISENDDILHTGAALYDDNKIYFFGDRFSINGASQIGFWLFKNKLSTNNATGTFNGTHSIGDILILTSFVDGEGKSTVVAYEWVGSGGSDGPLNLIPIPSSSIFAITNSNVEFSQWPFTPKSGKDGSFPIGAFFEGGINLSGLGFHINSCFSSFLIETRSSSLVTADLKDFIIGNFFTKPQVNDNTVARCINGDESVLSANMQGGSSPYSYLWTPGGATTESISVSPIVSTTYTVIVNAANGCATTAVKTISINPAPSCSIGNPDSDKLLCNHGNYTISTTMDPALYNLQWSLSVDGNAIGWHIIGTNTEQTITFSSGNCDTLNFQIHFLLTVTDKTTFCSTTCEKSFSPAVPTCNIQPIKAVPLNCKLKSEYLKAIYSTDIVNPMLNWTHNGNSIGSGINGTGVDSILISSPGSYIFSVTDSEQKSINCNSGVKIIENAVVPLLSDTSVNVSCNGLRDGYIDLTVNGGKPPYKYLWSTGETSEDISGLGAGNYTVTVTDSYGCIANKVFFITEPALIAIKTQITDVLCNGAQTGIITVNLSGGVSPYSYSINNGRYGTNNMFSNLEAGYYSIHVKDANGCEKAVGVTVSLLAAAQCMIVAPEVLPVCGTKDNPLTAIVSNALSYSWTVKGDGWAITSGQGTSHINYTAGKDSATFKLITVNSNQCKDTCMLSFGSGSCVMVTNFCTLTQEFYSQTKAIACATGERSDVLISRLLNDPFGNLVIGKTGRSLVITRDKAKCVIMKMQGSGPSAILPEGNQVFGNNCNTTIPLNSNGAFSNNLLIQTIALSLNLRLDSDLGALVIPGSSLITIGEKSGVDGKCGTEDDVPVFTDLINKTIPQSVLKALTVLYSKPTVENLFDLANRALGGQLTEDATLRDINNAVSAINEAFDACRFLKDGNATPTGIKNTDKIKDIVMKAYPNPFAKSTTIEFMAKKDGLVNVNVYTLSGLRVIELFNGKVKADDLKQLIFSGENLPNGIYIYKINVDDKIYFDKLILQK